jgi:hypothetical protein
MITCVSIVTLEKRRRPKCINQAELEKQIEKQETKRPRSRAEAWKTNEKALHRACSESLSERDLNL